MFDEGRPPVQHRLVLHPVVVEEEERLLTLFLQRQRGAVELGLVHLERVRTGSESGAAGSFHFVARPRLMYRISFSLHPKLEKVTSSVPVAVCSWAARDLRKASVLEKGSVAGQAGTH